MPKKRTARDVEPLKKLSKKINDTCPCARSNNGKPSRNCPVCGGEGKVIVKPRGGVRW